MKTGWLYKPVDNAPLIVFRIFFGFLLFAETFGAILTGWVKRNLIEPEFTFSHIGLEWLQPLPGNGMYFYFGTMAVLGIFVMLGLFYRYALGAFTLLWAGAYFMQKESYNNHYYLLLLICAVMLIQPANRFFSLDARRNPSIKQTEMPYWCSFIMIFQVGIVYFFATLAKFYPDWLNGNFIRLLLQYRQHYPIVGQWFGRPWFHLFLSYGGLFFDGLIVPFLLWKRTRTMALIASVVFHLFNSMVLQIGIFPFFALSFILFFYPTETIRKRFLPKKRPADRSTVFRSNPILVSLVIVPWFLIQIALPLRHWFIEGNVFWTEEGHRLSWRMMLRQRGGHTRFTVLDKKTGQSENYFLVKLKPQQLDFVMNKPDGIWQMAQRIRKEYAEKGKDVSVFVDSKVSVNGGPYLEFIDPKVDLAATDWHYFSHAPWIRLYDVEEFSYRERKVRREEENGRLR